MYVNYCEESDLMNPRCQKLSELDAKTAEMDKELYAERDPKIDEPTKIAKIYVTVYYAEKGEQKLLLSSKLNTACLFRHIKTGLL